MNPTLTRLSRYAGSVAWGKPTLHPIEIRTDRKIAPSLKMNMENSLKDTMTDWRVPKRTLTAQKVTVVVTNLTITTPQATHRRHALNKRITLRAMEMTPPSQATSPDHDHRRAPMAELLALLATLATITTLARQGVFEESDD